MKISGSPCPLDQISIIALKCSPYLRTYLTEIISQAWKAKTIPDTWKKAVTILIHKKDTTDDPSHFRPITLQRTALKVMTSFMRKRIFEFLSQNGYAENNIQKGFTPKITGTIEHTAHMAHLIRHAKKHQSALVITLIDLKNAFGEVHHNLLNCILEYHHIPTEMKSLISDLYTGFQTSVTTSSYSTSFIPIGITQTLFTTFKNFPFIPYPMHPLPISFYWFIIFIHWVTEIIKLHDSNINRLIPFHSGSHRITTGPTLLFHETPAGRGTFIISGSSPIYAVV